MESVEIKEIKRAIINKILEEYSTVDLFLETPFGKSLGKNVKAYLYPSGAVSYPVLKKLCEHFSIGSLRRSVTVTRSVNYYLKKKNGES